MTAPTEPAAPGSDTGESLAANRLGIAGIVFFVVAAAAPLVGMTGAVPVAIGLGNGAGAPGAYLVAGIVLLLFSVGYSTMSHEVSNAGAFYAYVGRGLGSVAGVGSAFVSLVAYLAVQLAIYGFFGSVAATQLNDKLGTNFHWWVWCLIAWAVVTALSILQVDIGAKVLGLLMGLEVLSLFVTALAVIFQGGGPDGLDLAASFAPSHVFAGGLNGGAGIALAFAFASFIGFEATAIYAEETKDPKRAVPIATYTAIVLIAALFALTSWAIVSGIGSDHPVDNVMKISDGLANPAEVVYSVAREFVGGWMATLMSWLVLSSLFAGLLAFQNSAARYFFALGRARVLPRALDRVNRHGAPVYGAVATSVVAGAVIVIFAAAHKDPFLNMFSWFSSMTVLAILLVEALVSLSVIVYFRNAPHWWKTILAPVLSIIGLGMAFYLVMARFGLLAGTVAKGVDPTTQSFGLSTLGWFLVLLPAISLVVGLVVGALRRSTENADAMADLVS
ncbi:APC family permease [Nocardioides sp. BP30]|uniref:APC family permease n=1 Tax=Nocardioides sp. BP30 TaxID=3036374 RepID=UPI002468C75E|nr:APC family permease [Nocardioides sp. BP30]WGL51951.1 APC family permease [Nocardioides sp. BP30]